MIDDLRVLSAVGTPSMQTRLLDNFTDNSSHRLETLQGYANDWQYIDWEGHNGPWSEFDSLRQYKATFRLESRPHPRLHFLGERANRQQQWVWSQFYSLAEW